ncbi:hypothetical protein R3Q06_33045 [Rhodococcus erythropolis]|uniref:hypothetical protein n=1 Tax=Rhodococcus erythropolis TaxID=1833 RepID=UPI00294967FA|nr:hypothetical protein [Rhodococcus erythropolis]MDV6278280.1 hypothetical protein [Rhodococcus erythropolis]
MTANGRKNRLHRLRKLAYAPLAVAVAAGAICTGVEIAAAAPAEAPITPAATDTPKSGDAYIWHLVNHTNQPIYGTWRAEMSTGDGSHVEATADHPWLPGHSDEDTQYLNRWRFTTWNGRICYNKHWWGFTFSDLGFGETNNAFWLEATSPGALFVYFDVANIGVSHKREHLIMQSDNC